jgi:hypothetical protein
MSNVWPETLWSYRICIISVVIGKIETMSKVIDFWIQKSEATEQSQMMSIANLVGQNVEVTATLPVS